MEPQRENLLAAVCPPNQREVFCSALLRWCLLNFTGFRAAFLERAASSPRIGALQNQGEEVDVRLEKSITGPDGKGRLDLAIEPSGGTKRWILGVEVKVTAPFAEGQKEKYDSWAEAQKEEGYSDVTIVTLTRKQDRPSEARKHLSWEEIYLMLKTETAPLNPLVQEILAYIETEVLPMKMNKLKNETLAQCYMVLQFEAELKAFLKELRQREPFDKYFAKQQATSEADKASNGTTWIGFYRRKTCREAKEQLVDLYVGFKIEREPKLCLFIQRQFGADEYSEQLRNDFKGSGWKPTENYESARLDVRLEQEVKSGEDPDGNPEAMFKWFKDKAAQAFEFK